jgi:hypothetical protein
VQQHLALTTAATTVPATFSAPHLRSGEHDQLPDGHLVTLWDFAALLNRMMELANSHHPLGSLLLQQFALWSRLHRRFRIKPPSRSSAMVLYACFGEED